MPFEGLEGHVVSHGHVRGGRTQFVTHLQEGLMEISLHVSALGLVLLGDQVPMLLGGGAVGKMHFSGVRKPLREEVTGDGVLKFPLDDLGSLF